MDATNIKYRIRQCSECPGDLKYFCETCSSDLCLQCGEKHMSKKLNKDTCNLILYREKSNYLQKHEICMRHPNNIYKKYCELCKIPICADCTEHGTHEQIDIRTAYEEKRRNREIIKKINNEAFPICYGLLAEIDFDFKTVISDVDHLNSKILRNSEKLTGCLENELNLEKLFVKLEIKINKYIARPYIYEQEYEQSSDAPIKFLSSVKKHQSKAFKKYRKITLTPCKSPKTETVIEKLTINLTSKGRFLEGTENINCRMAEVIKNSLSFWRGSLMLYPHHFPMDLMSEFGLGLLKLTKNLICTKTQYANSRFNIFIFKTTTFERTNSLGFRRYIIY